MEKRCEVCEGFRPGTKFASNYRVTEVNYDSRSVHLCTGHARIAENSGVHTFEQLRELYGTGRRSFVPRRSPNATGECGQARSPGRRATDVS
ncbi:MAG: hypothetical protein ACM3ZE_19905 [Myxococcales bacterium]